MNKLWEEFASQFPTKEQVVSGFLREGQDPSWDFTPYFKQIFSALIEREKEAAVSEHQLKMMGK